jgi:hypothetical protein
MDVGMIPLYHNLEARGAPDAVLPAYQTHGIHVGEYSQTVQNRVRYDRKGAFGTTVALREYANFPKGMEQLLSGIGSACETGAASKLGMGCPENQDLPPTPSSNGPGDKERVSATRQGESGTKPP